jgi:predicted site-specific integrase-resolvase
MKETEQLSSVEAARLLGVSPRSVTRWCEMGMFSKGRTKAQQGDDGHWRIPRRLVTSHPRLRAPTYGTDYVATLYGVTPATIRAWCESGKLKASIRSGRWRITDSALDDFESPTHHHHAA